MVNDIGVFSIRKLSWYVKIFQIFTVKFFTSRSIKVFNLLKRDGAREAGEGFLKKDPATWEEDETFHDLKKGPSPSLSSTTQPKGGSLSSRNTTVMPVKMKEREKERKVKERE